MDHEYLKEIKERMHVVINDPLTTLTAIAVVERYLNGDIAENLPRDMPDTVKKLTTKQVELAHTELYDKLAQFVAGEVARQLAERDSRKQGNAHD